MLVLPEIQLVPGTRTSDFFTPGLSCLKFNLSRAPGQVIFLPLHAYRFDDSSITSVGGVEGIAAGQMHTPMDGKQ